MKDSYRRYYEKNRDEILVRMRDRYVSWKAKRDEDLANDPSLLEGEREAARAKYHSQQARKTKRLIDGYLADTTTPDTLKAFLQNCLKDDKYKSFTPKAMERIYAVGIPASPLVTE